MLNISACQRHCLLVVHTSLCLSAVPEMLIGMRTGVLDTLRTTFIDFGNALVNNFDPVSASNLFKAMFKFAILCINERGEWFARAAGAAPQNVQMGHLSGGDIRMDRW